MRTHYFSLCFGANERQPCFSNLLVEEMFNRIIFLYSFLILYCVAEINCPFGNFHPEKRRFLKLVETLEDLFSKPISLLFHINQHSVLSFISEKLVFLSNFVIFNGLFYFSTLSHVIFNVFWFKSPINFVNVFLFRKSFRNALLHLHSCPPLQYFMTIFFGHTL